MYCLSLPALSPKKTEMWDGLRYKTSYGALAWRLTLHLWLGINPPGREVWFDLLSGIFFGCGFDLDIFGTQWSFSLILYIQYAAMLVCCPDLVAVIHIYLTSYMWSEGISNSKMLGEIRGQGLISQIWSVSNPKSVENSSGTPSCIQPVLTVCLLLSFVQLIQIWRSHFKSIPRPTWSVAFLKSKAKATKFLCKKTEQTIRNPIGRRKEANS